MSVSGEPEIRENAKQDSDAIEALYPRAFPDEDLVPLVLSLLKEPETALSLVASADDEVVGHVMFTYCRVADGKSSAALLAPLAVDPAWQRRGIGTALVEDGLSRLRDKGVQWVCVLGDPGYYGRLGFLAERRIAPPYPLPPEWDGAWQSLTLGEADGHPSGTLAVPVQWQQRALWAP